jgi:hypothetical protein
MSWIGQSLAAHRITIAATKQTMLSRVIGFSPARTAAGPIPRTT